MKQPIQRLFLTLFAFAILVGASAWVRAEGLEERHRALPLLVFLGASVLGFLANLLRFQARRASAILFFYFPAFIVPLTPWLSNYLPARGYLALQAQGVMLALGVILSVALLSGGLFPSRNAHATSVQRAVIHAGWLGASLAPFLLAGMFLWGWDTWRTIWLPAGAITVLAGISAWRLAGPWKRRRWVGWYPVMVFGGVLALSALVMSGMAAWRFAAMLLG